VAEGTAPPAWRAEAGKTGAFEHMPGFKLKTLMEFDSSFWLSPYWQRSAWCVTASSPAVVF
jgi:hypothetical protein